MDGNIVARSFSGNDAIIYIVFLDLVTEILSGNFEMICMILRAIGDTWHLLDIGKQRLVILVVFGHKSGI